MGGRAAVYALLGYAYAPPAMPMVPAVPAVGEKVSAVAGGALVALVYDAALVYEASYTEAGDTAVV